MNYKPLQDYVLGRHIPRKSVTGGGIVIPDNAAPNEPDMFETLAVGPDVKHLEKGDVFVLGNSHDMFVMSADPKNRIILTPAKSIVATVIPDKGKTVRESLLVQ